MFTYNTKGTCSRQIIFDVDGENKIHNVKFIGGCSGNLCYNSNGGLYRCRYDGRWRVRKR